MAAAKVLTKETITIGQVGQYGVKVGNDWLGVNKPLELSSFAAGSTYDVLTNIGKPTEKNPNGKKYINQIVNESAATLGSPAGNATVTTSPKSNPLAEKDAAPKARATASDYEEAKNRRIARQGAIQHALISPFVAGLPLNDIAAFKAVVKDLADFQVAYVEGK